jgi:hypothetical protein
MGETLFICPLRIRPCLPINGFLSDWDQVGSISQFAHKMQAYSWGKFVLSPGMMTSRVVVLPWQEEGSPDLTCSRWALSTCRMTMAWGLESSELLGWCPKSSCCAQLCLFWRRMWPFGPEPSDFSVAVEKLKNENIQDCNFACGSEWVWNLVSDVKGGTQTGGVWEQGAEDDVWTKER